MRQGDWVTGIVRTAFLAAPGIPNPYPDGTIGADAWNLGRKMANLPWWGRLLMRVFL